MEEVFENEKNVFYGGEEEKLVSDISLGHYNNLSQEILNEIN